MINKVVLAYSGGLDTSAIVPWLIENYGCEVVAVVGDVGQDPTELEGIEEKAIRSGASACHIVDLKREFIRDFAFPALRAGAVYEGRYLLGTALARPSLARAQVEIAKQVGADAVAHGCTGKGNDQVRFETVFAALAPHLKVIAPWREWDMKSREDLLAYCEQKGVPCTASVTKIYSRDANLWHMSHEGGELEDPWNAPPESVWTVTEAPTAAPETPEEVTLEFEHGVPIALNGVALEPEVLVADLNAIAARHGVGRLDLVENRVVGMKSRGCYETPAGTVLHEALRSLEELVLDRATLHFRHELGLKLADLIYDGKWFTPVREAAHAAVAKISEPVTGEVIVRLVRGSAVVTQRRSPNSLYSEDFATFGEDDVYDHADAGGFIRLFSLPSRIAAVRSNDNGVVTTS